MARTKPQAHRTAPRPSGGKGMAGMARAMAAQKCPRSKFAAGVAAGGVKKPHRYHPGTVAVREIRKRQKETRCYIPRAAFGRLVREIADAMSPNGKDYRFQLKALDALRESAEAFVVGVFADTQELAFHAGRITVMPSDMRLALKIRTAHKVPVAGGYHGYDTPAPANTPHGGA